MQDKKKNKCSIISSLSCPADESEMFPVVTLIRGKAPDLSSLREKEQLLMNLQGLDCLRLQTVHML